MSRRWGWSLSRGRPTPSVPGGRQRGQRGHSRANVCAPVVSWNVQETVREVWVPVVRVAGLQDKRGLWCRKEAAACCPAPPGGWGGPWTEPPSRRSSSAAGPEVLPSSWRRRIVPTVRGGREVSRVPDTLAVSWCDRQSGSRPAGSTQTWTVGGPDARAACGCRNPAPASESASRRTRRRVVVPAGIGAQEAVGCLNHGQRPGGQAAPRSLLCILVCLCHPPSRPPPSLPHLLKRRSQGQEASYGSRCQVTVLSAGLGSTGSTLRAALAL